MCGVAREARSPKEGLLGRRRLAGSETLPLPFRALAPPSSGNWQAAPPMRCGCCWVGAEVGVGWDGTDGRRQGNPHVLLHLLHLIDFPQKEKR